MSSTLSSTLEYLIIVHNGKLDFMWVSTKDNFMLLNNQFNTFSINLNAQDVIGMTLENLITSIKNVQNGKVRFI